MKEFNWNEYYNWMLDHQYEIPRRLEYKAISFGRELTYNQIKDLYALSIQDILTIYNIKSILDLPFGQGYMLAQKKWIDKMTEAVKVLHNKKDNR